ncbi:MAG: hypothetical protein K2W95_00110 [Candidatus Obscuribacterales bacterium]|nr:hypothetical protein [Candidatus Obscuribacterales bacterium]
MEGGGPGLWLQKQLKPLSKGVTPEALSWASLAASMIAGGLLYGAYQRPWLGLIAAPILAIRLALDSLESISDNEHPDRSPYSRMLSRLCDRLADVSLFLGLTFWPPDVMRVHLALLAIICMLIVSYVGELGRASGSTNHKGGMLSQSHRIVLLMFFCVVHAVRPGAIIAGFSTFEVMFALFIPLASITLIQRMDVLSDPTPPNQDD